MKAALIALILPAYFAHAGPAIVFEKLPVGDSIHVNYSSRGCFHNLNYEFEFERGKSFTAKVTEIRYQQSTEKMAKPEEAKRFYLGKIDLSEQEVIGLDRLFAFYRSNKDMGCTTVDDISATQRRGRSVKASESFTDGSCAVHDLPKVTPLYSIIAKLKPE